MNRDNRPYSGPVEAVKPNPTATFGPPGEQSSGGYSSPNYHGEQQSVHSPRNHSGANRPLYDLMVPIHHRTVMVKTGIIAMVANRRSHRNILMHGVVALF